MKTGVVKASSTMQSSNKFKQVKCHPLNWIRPIPFYGFVPFMIGLFSFMDGDSLDKLSLYAKSANFLFNAIPVYILAIVWLTIRRVKQGNNTPELRGFQIAALVPPAFWLCLGLGVNGIV